VIIGDTGTGKSDVSTELFKYANVGYRISGSTASRNGITYSIDYDERRGWRIKAGAHLKMSGQALIVDEAQDLPEAELKTMAEALDSGQLQVDRVQNKKFEAETRVIFLCNPRDPRRFSD
jgi:DNA replicative helicase MCM subunit Mcm2 (Cdc46/Mcm family)